MNYMTLGLSPGECPSPILARTRCARGRQLPEAAGACLDRGSLEWRSCLRPKAACSGLESDNAGEVSYLKIDILKNREVSLTPVLLPCSSINSLVIASHVT